MPLSSTGYVSVQKKIKGIKTGFDGEVGDCLLMLEAHYFCDICTLRAGQPYCCYVKSDHQPG